VDEPRPQPPAHEADSLPDQDEDAPSRRNDAARQEATHSNGLDDEAEDFGDEGRDDEDDRREDDRDDR
jgi:hypothetical protein